MGSGISRGDPEWSGEKHSYKESPVLELGNDSGVFIGNVLEGSGMSGTPEGKGYMNVSLQVGMIASCAKCHRCPK